MSDLTKKYKIVFSEALASFRKNKDLTAAASLAFTSTLALIPVLFLLAVLVGASIGSSEQTFAKAQELLIKMVPAYSQDIIEEVQFISSNVGAISILNLLMLFWSITPLVSNMRVSLGTIFRNNPTRPFLLEKLFDVAISIVFLMGLTAIAVFGVVYTLMLKKSLLHVPLGYLEGLAPFFFIIGVAFLLYYAFSTKMRARNLLIGSVVTAFLWFMMTPAFHLFITYNPGFGFAFGSFKSLFVAIIWVYYSLVVFLLGAEIAACLERDETVFIKKLIEGSKNVPRGIFGKYVVHFEKGAAVYSEGDLGNVMYGVLKGSVAIHKGDKVIATILPGKCFGAISFLLSVPRVASAIALEDVDLVVISNENIDALMNEYPEFVIEILREIAFRLREANKVVE